MLVMTGSLGDFHISLTAHQSLGSSEGQDKENWFTLRVIDLPTGKSAEMSIPGRLENKAVLLFAAWLCADEGDIGVLGPLRKELRETFPKEFLP